MIHDVATNAHATRLPEGYDLTFNVAYEVVPGYSVDFKEFSGPNDKFGECRTTSRTAEGFVVDKDYTRFDWDYNYYYLGLKRSITDREEMKRIVTEGDTMEASAAVHRYVVKPGKFAYGKFDIKFLPL